MNNVVINSPSGKLTGTMITPEGIPPSGKALLFIHGWTSTQARYVQRAQALAPLGYTSLAFNLPGHGDSEGDINTLTRKEYLDAVIAAYDFLKSQKHVDPDAIGVIGASFGGYLAALLTIHRPIRWLVMRAAANYVDEGFDTISQMQYKYENPQTEQWRTTKLNPTDTMALSAVHEFPHETLIIESELDTIVPHQSVQNYADAVADSAKLTHVVMKGADHQLSSAFQQQEFIRILVDWFGKKK